MSEPKTVRTIKELRTACKWLLNFGNSFWAEDLKKIADWITRTSCGDTGENQLKNELYQHLVELKKYAGKYGFIDKNTGEILDSVYDSVCPVVIKNKNFWFTGKAFYGARSKCVPAITEKGGTVLENKKPDYIIVGLFSATVFREEYYSSKIEYALSLKTDRYVDSIGVSISFNAEGFNVKPMPEKKLIKASPISIISEDYWMKFI